MKFALENLERQRHDKISGVRDIIHEEENENDYDAIAENDTKKGD